MCVLSLPGLESVLAPNKTLTCFSLNTVGVFVVAGKSRLNPEGLWPVCTGVLIVLPMYLTGGQAVGILEYLERREAQNC